MRSAEWESGENSENGGYCDAIPGLTDRRHSFREIVRVQLLARFLLDHASAASEAVVSDYGFGDQCRLENAVFDQFGVPVDLLSRIEDRDHCRSSASQLAAARD